MVNGGDSVFVQIGTFGQVCPQNAVVGHVHEGNHGVPALVVVPHLQSETICQLGPGSLSRRTASPSFSISIIVL